MTPDKQERLRALIERLERATGPDRLLDANILWAIDPHAFAADGGLGDEHLLPSYCYGRGGWTLNKADRLYLDTIPVPRFTGSIDAAVGLAERVSSVHGRKLICFFCAGGQLTPENADAGSADYHPLAKIDNSVTVGWMSHVAFMKNGSGETFGPDRYSHGKTAPVAICLALLRALSEDKT